MNKRILAAFLAVLLLLFTLTSCEAPQFITDFISEIFEEEKIGSEKPPMPAEDSYLEAHFIDVGQADCTLLICDGEAMLIDAGNFDAEEIILPYLEALGIDHFTAVVVRALATGPPGKPLKCLNFRPQRCREINSSSIKDLIAAILTQLLTKMAC